MSDRTGDSKPSTLGMGLFSRGRSRTRTRAGGDSRLSPDIKTQANPVDTAPEPNPAPPATAPETITAALPEATPNPVVPLDKRPQKRPKRSKSGKKLGRPRKKGPVRQSHVTFNVTPEERMAFARAAAADGRTLSEWSRRMIYAASGLALPKGVDTP